MKTFLTNGAWLARQGTAKHSRPLPRARHWVSYGERKRTKRGRIMEASEGARVQAGVLLARGVCRMLAAHGLAGVTEVPLANGRRADVMTLDRKSTRLN